MKFIISLIILFSTTICFSQEIKPVTKGTITLCTNQKIKFRNLKYKEGMVTFVNMTTNSDFTYFLNAVRLIEDESNTVIYKRIEETKSKENTVEIISDTLFRPNYPPGIYKTKEDFINKKATPEEGIAAKGLIGIEKPFLADIEHSCYFYTRSDRKIKNVFAISYEGHLYFQIDAILSNRNKTDRAQDSQFPNGFVRVIMGGENYYYTEADLSNLWAQALSYGAVGGAAGGYLAKSAIYGKGVVWDFKNQEFNIFKNCSDYNDFIKAIYPEGVQDCPKQQPNIWKIRKDMEKVK